MALVCIVELVLQETKEIVLVLQVMVMLVVTADRLVMVIQQVVAVVQAEQVYHQQAIYYRAMVV